MRKIYLVTIFAVLLIFGTVNVKALNEEGLKEKLFQTIEVGNGKYSLSNDQKKLVETYLEQNEISDKDAAVIGEKIDEAIAIIKKQGNINFTKYPQKVKNELKALVADISRDTKVKATLTKDGLIVKNSDGTETIITSLVKQTGYESSKTALIVGISFVIVAVGTCLVVKQLKASE